MTVKELKEFLKDLPDDAKIIVAKTAPEEPRFTYEKSTCFNKIIERVSIE